MIESINSNNAIGPSGEVFYIPDFLTEEEEQYVMRKIRDSPQHKWKNLKNRRLQLIGGQLTGKNILIPEAFPPFVDKYPDIISRLKNAGIFMTSPHGAPNHIILNEYLPGQGIMPHEDGPAYHPIVATLSLGSHAVFHYYQYKSAERRDGTGNDPANENEGQPIDPKPALSVLLEPRSVIITTGSFYRSHLHGIEEVSEDVFSRGDGVTGPQIQGTGVEIANWKLVSGSKFKDAFLNGGSLKRDVRYSLTCRDVVRVVRNTSALYPWRP
ncbi:alkbh6 protein [Moniliophthora roreri]|uniref:Fe2OG dioxygenase domain-containing protein n=1 Tax=Moniliophthora roreri TaxID=221103 RepID=A0A0W0FLV0_MONRR|nr:alkbh6 protein [Moniliophthora roreri]